MRDSSAWTILRVPIVARGIYHSSAILLHSLGIEEILLLLERIYPSIATCPSWFWPTLLIVIDTLLNCFSYLKVLLESWLQQPPRIWHISPPSWAFLRYSAYSVECFISSSSSFWGRLLICLEISHTSQPSSALCLLNVVLSCKTFLVRMIVVLERSHATNSDALQVLNILNGSLAWRSWNIWDSVA